MLEAWIHTGMAAPHTMASAAIAVPEPGYVASLVSGLALLGWLKRRRANEA